MRKIYMSLVLFCLCVFVAQNILIYAIQAQEVIPSNGNVVSLYRAGLIGADTVPEEQRLAMAVYALHRSEKSPETVTAMWDITKQYLEQNSSQPVNDRLRIVELFFSTLENMLVNVDSETVFTEVWNVRKSVLEERNRLAEALHAEGKKLLVENREAILTFVTKLPVVSNAEGIIVSESDLELEKQLENSTNNESLKKVFETISVLDSLESNAQSAQEYQTELVNLEKEIIQKFQDKINQMNERSNSFNETVVPVPKDPKKTGKDNWLKGKATVMLEEIQGLSTRLEDSFMEDYFHLSEIEEYQTLYKSIVNLNEKVQRMQILRYNYWAFHKMEIARDKTKNTFDLIDVATEYLYPIVAPEFNAVFDELLNRAMSDNERRKQEIQRQISAEKVPLSAF